RVRGPVRRGHRAARRAQPLVAMSRAEKNGAHRSTHVRSIERALAILEQLASSGTACSLSGLASSVGLPSGTTHRVVQTLVAHGYVRQLENREYVLGPSLDRKGVESESRHRLIVSVILITNRLIL